MSVNKTLVFIFSTIFSHVKDDSTEQGASNS